MKFNNKKNLSIFVSLMIIMFSFNVSCANNIDKDIEIEKEVKNSEDLKLTENTEVDKGILNEEDVDFIIDVREESGKETTIQGIVTAIIGDYDVFLQDCSAGITLSKYKVKDITDLEIGDKIQVEGIIEIYKDNSQIHPLNKDSVKIISKNEYIDPMLIFTTDNTNDVEGMLVKLENVIIKTVDKYGNYTVEDEFGETLVRPPNGIKLELNMLYEEIIGVSKFNYGQKIILRDENDFVIDQMTVSKVESSLIPSLVEEGTEIELYTNTDDANIYYEIGNDINNLNEPNKNSNLYSEKIILNKDNTIIKAIAIKEGMNSSKIVTFEYEIGTSLKIRDIQGLSHYSNYDGKDVKGIKGIVTGFIKNKGFFMQEPDSSIDNDLSTCEGIFVRSKEKVFPGDMVSVDGQVVEKNNDNWDYTLTETQINSNKVSILSNNNKLPNALSLTKLNIPTEIVDNDSMTEFNPNEDALDFYESLEGMLVRIENPLIVGADERYGEVYVLNNGGENSSQKMTFMNGIKFTDELKSPEVLTIDDDIRPITSYKTRRFYDLSFRPTVGDSFTESIDGIMSYSYGKYKILNKNKLPDLLKGDNKRKETSLEWDENSLHIASYNIENFYLEESEEKTKEIAKSIVKDLKTPDIVALVEMQDDDGDTKSDIVKADKNYQGLIEEIKSISLELNNEDVSYSYTEIAPRKDLEGGKPGGNIRVGYIYRDDRVKLKANIKGLSTQEVYIKEDGSLSSNPSRIGTNQDAFEHTRIPLLAEFVFNEESYYVVGCHFSSKRGDSPVFGTQQPQVQGSLEKRCEQSRIVNNFVKELLVKKPKSNVIILGDLNDYEFSKTLEVLKGEEMINLVDELPFEERFTYNHNGISQVLDNAVITKALYENKNVSFDIVNINSPFVKADGRVSDHDPVLIKISNK